MTSTGQETCLWPAPSIADWCALPIGRDWAETAQYILDADDICIKTGWDGRAI